MLPFGMFSLLLRCRFIPSTISFEILQFRDVVEAIEGALLLANTIVRSGANLRMDIQLLVREGVSERE